MSKLNNFGISEVKEEDLMDELNQKLRHNGVLVSPHIKGGNKEVDVRTVVSNEEEIREFLSGHYKGSKISFLSDSERAQLKQEKNYVFRALRGYTLSDKMYFLTFDSYRRFNKEFNESKERYEKIVSNLVSNFDNIEERFRINVLNYLEESISSKEKREGIWNKIKRSIPQTKVQFQKEFEFTLDAFLFQGVDNNLLQNINVDEEILEALKSSQEKNTWDLAHDMFSKLSSITLCEAEKMLNSKTMNEGTLEKAIYKLNDFNFMESKDVLEWKKELEQVKGKSKETQAENAEYLIYRVWKFVKENDLENTIIVPKGLEINYLDSLLSIY